MKNPHISEVDELLLHRLLDGELDARATAELQARLGSEPGLRCRFEEEQALRAGFLALRAGGRTAPAAFTAGVVAAVRRLPSRNEIEQSEVTDGIRQLCRRLLIAAAVLFGIGLAWHGGLFERGRSDTLQAAPDEIEREIGRLDALIEKGVLEPRDGRTGSADGHTGERRVK